MTTTQIQSFFNELEKIAVLGDPRQMMGGGRASILAGQKRRMSLGPIEPNVKTVMNRMTRQGVLKSPQTAAAHLADSMARKGKMVGRVVVR